MSDLQTPQRMERGLVVILPGIEGRSKWNYDLARGLDEGGVKSAIQVYQWGTSIPAAGLLINLTDHERNQRAAAGLRDHLLAYRRDYPGRSIHLIGHSGGGGVAVLTLEALPEDAQVSSAILLAAALSPDYDLSAALRRTRHGIFNYYSKLDQAFLGLGTTVAGTIDRRYTLAAGAVGFVRPASLTPQQKALYGKLHQIEWQPQMSWAGHLGGHLDWTDRRFVRKYLAPLILDLSGGPLGPDLAGGFARGPA